MDIQQIFAARQQAEQNRRLECYRRLNRVAKKGQIVFAGSSLMEQFPIDELQHSLDLPWCIYNRGIGGYVSSQMLQGLETMVLELEPAKLFINIGTNDMEDAANTGLNTSALRTSVKVKNVYTNLNLMNGDVGEDATVTFGENDIPEGQFTANSTTYDYLALNYLLVGTDKGVVDCEFKYTDGTTNGNKTISNVPVQRNYRTNIIGSILTGAVDLNVTIDPAFEEPDNN